MFGLWSILSIFICKAKTMQWNRAIIIMLLCLAPAIAAVAPERDIAERVIRQGGRVMLNGDRRPIGDLTQLPTGERRITGVDLTGRLINPHDLEQLSGLASL